MVKITRGPAGVWGGACTGDVGRVVSSAGFFSARVEIELTSGARVWVDRKDVRRTALQGDGAWAVRRTWEQAKFVSGCITVLLLLGGCLLDYLHGGSPATYFLGLGEGLLIMVLGWVLGPYGLFVIGAFVLWRLARRRS